jgi:hypothetical protein
MRIVVALLAALIAAGPLAASAAAPAALPTIKLQNANQSLGWIKAYRAHPSPSAVPDLMKQLAALGAFQEPDGAGLYVGFMAGVIGSNAKTAPKLAAQMAAALPAADQWSIIKAIAYSRLSGWRELLKMTEAKLPTRTTMVEAYLDGKLAGFDRYRIPVTPSPVAKAWAAITFAKPDPTIYLEPSPVMLDTLWGYYFATGSTAPLADIANLTIWSKDINDVAHLTIGSSAKYSLAANASRDQALLADVKKVRGVETQQIQPILDEAIFAAETSETDKLHDDAAAAIAELRAKGPASLRKIAWWGNAGEGAISLGCVVAAATGQEYLGIPCVIGGAVASGVLHYFATPSPNG